MASPREPSMEDILASIKRVIAEEKEIRAAAPPPGAAVADEADVLELDHRADGGAEEPEPFAALQMEEAAPVPMPAPDPGPALVDAGVADRSRSSLEALATFAADPPAPLVNPLEEMVREMLRPLLKQWLDDHLSTIVEEHVRREVSRITGRSL